MKGRDVWLLLTGAPIKHTSFSWDVASISPTTKHRFKIADGLRHLPARRYYPYTQNGGIYHFLVCLSA